MKKKELKPVDHSKISYIDVRKNLYIIPKALAQAADEQASTGSRVSDQTLFSIFACLSSPL